MKRIDRILVASLTLGVWALVAFALFGSKPVSAQFDLTSAVQSIIQNCTVYGNTSGSISGEVFIYGMPHGQIEGGSFSGNINGYISC